MSTRTVSTCGIVAAAIAAAVAGLSCSGSCLDIAYVHRVTMTRQLDVSPGELADQDAEVCVRSVCESGRAPAPDGKPVRSAFDALLTLTPTSDGRVELRAEIPIYEQEAPVTIEVRLARTSGERVTAAGTVEWRERDACHAEPVRREI